jgi:DNA-binding CsgD family transcriptional regulator
LVDPPVRIESLLVLKGSVMKVVAIAVVVFAGGLMLFQSFGPPGKPPTAFRRARTARDRGLRSRSERARKGRRAKPFDEGELLARVRSALRHSAIPSSNSSQGDPTAEALTTREREVLKLLARGLTQAESAQGLFISPKTVAGHIQRVLTKLGVHSRAQAVALAHEQGLADVQGHALLRLLETG